MRSRFSRKDVISSVYCESGIETDSPPLGAWQRRISSVYCESGIETVVLAVVDNRILFQVFTARAVLRLLYTCAMLVPL